IKTNRANLAHGRLPSMWFASAKPPYGTLDAAEWAPSTASKADIDRQLWNVRFGPITDITDVCFAPSGSALLVETSTITCPKCGHQATEIMPTDACQVSYDCKGCGQQAEAGTLPRLLLFWVSAVSAEQVQAN